jgi:aminopeptidase N
VIEYAERDASGHDAFTAFARTLIKPAAERLGWQASAEETPDITSLRQTLLADLGSWGDPGTIAEAQRRFQAFLRDHASLPADLQPTVLGIVAQNADAATFAQLNQLAQGAANDTELERYYRALGSVRDPALAAQVLQIAVSDQLPPQAATVGLHLVFSLAARFHQASWETFTAHWQKLLKALPTMSTLILGEYLPEIYWDSVPLDQLQAWIQGNVPAEAADTVERGMQTARFKRSQKQALIPETDAFLSAQHGM